MAKASPIPELGEDDPFAAAAAKVVAVRARELAGEAEGVLDTSDIERVHDMRVATRRLRAALEVFQPCFPKKRFRTALKEVKALADALGERRDRDVHIAELAAFEAELSAADRAGVRSFVRRLREEQADANLALAPYVTKERIAALCERLDDLVAEARAEYLPATEDIPATSSASPPGVPGLGGTAPDPAPAPAVTNGGEPR
jgi:CHAD domain-containing protein